MLDFLYNFFISPFYEFYFMKNALISLIILSFSSSIVGIFLTIKKLCLSGDAISHAILPGAAIGFLFFGLSVTAITICSFIGGIIVIIFSSLFSRISKSSEENSLAVFYLISIALGVLIISISGSNLDLLHFLFGSLFAISNEIIITLSIISLISVFTIAIIIRPLIIDCMDPLFFKSVSNCGSLVHLIFMIIIVMNLVGGFQAIGTLMSVGILILPSISARFWSNKLYKLIFISFIATIISSYFGLCLSFNLDLPSSPCIILSLGVFYIFSFIFGLNNGIIWKFIKTNHLEN